MLFLNNTFESAEICLNNCILNFKYLSIIYKLSFFEKIGCFCHDIRVKFHLLDESNPPNNLPYQADVCLDARHQTFEFCHMGVSPVTSCHLSGCRNAPETAFREK